MDFRIERSRLIGPLQQVAKFAGSRALNMLDGVRIELSKAGLELAGGDSDRFLKLQLPNEQLEAHAFGSVVLSAKTLLDIVRKADDGRIRFTKLNGHYVSVTSDSSSFRLAGHPADDYPDFEVIGTKDGPIIELQAGELVRLIPRY
jgi:DNA polymerase-3 subunit beta